MADVFSCEDARKLFKDKFILLVGDSNMRAIYKDLLILLHDGVMTPQFMLKKGSQAEPQYGDYFIAQSPLTRGRSYFEVRECKRPEFGFWIRHIFITKVVAPVFLDELTNIECGAIPPPDIVLLNSLIWDITRWGPQQEDQYKENVATIFHRLRDLLPPTSLVIWLSSLPVATERVKGGVFIPQLEFIKHSMRFIILEANTFISNLCQVFDIAFLDLHYYMQHQLNRRTNDGLHWEPPAVRYITNLILTHIALSIGAPLPGKIEDTFLLKKHRKALMEPKEGKTIYLNTEIAKFLKDELMMELKNVESVKSDEQEKEEEEKEGERKEEHNKEEEEEKKEEERENEEKKEEEEKVDEPSEETEECVKKKIKTLEQRVKKRARRIRARKGAKTTTTTTTTTTTSPNNDDTTTTTTTTTTTKPTPTTFTVTFNSLPAPQSLLESDPMPGPSASTSASALAPALGQPPQNSKSKSKSKSKRKSKPKAKAKAKKLEASQGNNAIGRGSSNSSRGSGRGRGLDTNRDTDQVGYRAYHPWVNPPPFLAQFQTHDDLNRVVTDSLDRDNWGGFSGVGHLGGRFASRGGRCTDSGGGRGRGSGGGDFMEYSGPSDFDDTDSDQLDHGDYYPSINPLSQIPQLQIWDHMNTNNMVNWGGFGGVAHRDLARGGGRYGFTGYTHPSVFGNGFGRGVYDF